MKALLILMSLMPSLCLAKSVIYMDYKFNIPNGYNAITNDISEASNSLFILTEDKTSGFTIEKMLEDGSHSFKPKEFNLSTHRELFYTLYNDDIPSTNKKILEVRGIYKKFPLQKHSISERNDFVFFRTDNGMDLIGVSFLISTPKNDEILKIDFVEEYPSEKFIKSTLDSLELR